MASVAYAESDPWWYGVGYGYPYGYGYGYALARPCVNNAGLAVPCAQGHPLVNTQARRKREADPALVYTGLGLHYPLTYAHPLVYGAAVATTQLQTLLSTIPILYCASSYKGQLIKKSQIYTFYMCLVQ